MHRTFAIIKPDAVATKKAGGILARIEKEGFTVRAMRLMHMTKGEAEGFYAVHKARPFFEDITVEYDPGTTTEVRMHDGSRLLLKKLGTDYNPTDRMQALHVLHETLRRGEFATGVIYVEPDKDDFITQLNLVDTPLAALPMERTRPSQAVLDEVMESLR